MFCSCFVILYLYAYQMKISVNAVTVKRTRLHAVLITTETLKRSPAYHVSGRLDMTVLLHVSMDTLVMDVGESVIVTTLKHVTQ